MPGYQEQHFSRLQQRRFFSHTYTVSDRCDRMGYRLEGAAIDCDIEGILSEGICYGAIQVPADGQPIVLLNDRQTIGGYPKIGSALSLDAARLAQLTPGATVDFAPISVYAAHNALRLARSFSQRQQLLGARDHRWIAHRKANEVEQAPSVERSPHSGATRLRRGARLLQIDRPVRAVQERLPTLVLRIAQLDAQQRAAFGLGGWAHQFQMGFDRRASAFLDVALDATANDVLPR